MLQTYLYPLSDFHRRIENLARSISPGNQTVHIDIPQWIEMSKTMQLHDTFGWTFDVQRGIENPFNTYLHLGLPEKDLNVPQILHRIPGMYKMMFLEYRLAFYELLLEKQWRFFLDAKGVFKMNTLMYSSRSDSTFSISMTSRVSRTDPKGNAVAYFNQFHIFSEWDCHPLIARPRLFLQEHNSRFMEMEKAIHALAFKRIRKRFPFTDREWQIIDLRANGAESRESAARLKRSPHTVSTHNRHILEHARACLSGKFINIQEVGNYLNDMYLTRSSNPYKPGV
ncbi:MAG: LuxR C-terminal-related transcriptional regulator [Saprospiraceae bacterium]